MPRIPTYTADGGLRAAPTSPDASPLAFNATAGLESIAGGIGAIGGLAANFAAKKQADVAETYVSSSLRELDEKSAKFIHDANLKGSTTIPDDFKKFFDAELSQRQKDAPNDIAAKEIAKRGNNTAANLYAHSLKLASNNFIELSVKEIDQSTIAIQNTYRSMSSLDPDGATVYLEQAYKDQRESINKRFGDIAPTLASERRAALDNDMAYAAADNDPDLARRIVDESTDLNARTKDQIRRHIDAVQDGRKTSSTFATELAIKTQIADVLSTGKPMEIPESLLADLPPSKRDLYRHEATIANQVVIEYGNIKELNSAAQSNYIASIDDTGNPVKREVKNKLLEMTAKTAKFQREDPSGWLRSNNVELASAYRFVESLPEYEKAEQLDWIAKRSLELQGPPPAGTPENQRGKYLNLPTGMQRVLDRGTASAWAAQINNTSQPNRLFGVIQEFNNQFKDPEIAARAYQDLVSLPENGINPGVKLVLSIQNQDVAVRVLGAIQNREAVKKLTPETMQKITSDIEADPTFLAIRESFAGDNFQRMNELLEIRDGIAAYAAALGDTKAALKHTLSDNWGTVNQKGVTFAIYRQRKDGRLFSDDELKTIEAGMSATLANFDTDQIVIDSERFPTTAPFAQNGIATGAEASVIVKSAIRNAGFFLPEPDGETVTLYVKDASTSVPLQIIGKNGQPFKYKLEDFNRPQTEARKFLRDPNLIISPSSIDVNAPSLFIQP